jgi:hypothetical protein
MLHQTSQNNHRRICANAIQAHRKDDNWNLASRLLCRRLCPHAPPEAHFPKFK